MFVILSGWGFTHQFGSAPEAPSPPPPLRLYHSCRVSEIAQRKYHRIKGTWRWQVMLVDSVPDTWFAPQGEDFLFYFFYTLCFRDPDRGARLYSCQLQVLCAAFVGLRWTLDCCTCKDRRDTSTVVLELTESRVCMSAYLEEVHWQTKNQRCSCLVKQLLITEKLGKEKRRRGRLNNITWSRV